MSQNSIAILARAGVAILVRKTPENVALAARHVPAAITGDANSELPEVYTTGEGERVKPAKESWMQASHYCRN